MNEQSDYQIDFKKNINETEKTQEKIESIQPEFKSVFDKDYKSPITLSEAKAIHEELKKRRKQWETENETFIREEIYDYNDPYTRNLRR